MKLGVPSYINTTLWNWKWKYCTPRILNLCTNWQWLIISTLQCRIPYTLWMKNGWTPELVWKLWRREQSVALGIRFCISILQWKLLGCNTSPSLDTPRNQLGRTCLTKRSFGGSLDNIISSLNSALFLEKEIYGFSIDISSKWKCRIILN